MIWVAVFYWIVCGFAMWVLPEVWDARGLGFELVCLIVCLLIGGFVVPARLVAKAVR